MSLKKRKSIASEVSPVATKKLRAISDEKSGETRIQALTADILESSKNYNKILDLLKLARKSGETREVATLELCRAFSALWLQGRLKRSPAQTKEAKQVVDWLHGRYSEYKSLLQQRITSGDDNDSRVSLSLHVQLVQAEVESNPEVFANIWQRGSFHELVNAAVVDAATVLPSEELISSYALKYEDIRYLVTRSISRLFEQPLDEPDTEALDRAITILSKLGDHDITPPDPSDPSEPANIFPALLFTKKRPYKKDDLKRRTGETYLALLRLRLPRPARRRLLSLIPTHIEPNIGRPELLLDFLTDSCDAGGSEAVSALQGLHRLMTEHGLDYPLLYHKLYALLDAQSLHKKHRTRLLRLANTFLGSTHLPAVIVASFIKRLSRLALYAPPAAIVAIVPLVYNLLQGHPACTPMVHRKLPGTSGRDADDEDDNAEFEDPFDAAETDPNLTGAIESSVWELDTLRTHWHPNVATIAKILAEQFLKQAYNLEDFLDHSYGSLFDNEVAKQIVKPPVVEYHIPKQIFTDGYGEQDTRNGLLKLWKFS